jgi:hypothetical protein
MEQITYFLTIITFDLQDAAQEIRSTFHPLGR